MNEVSDDVVAGVTTGAAFFETFRFAGIILSKTRKLNPKPNPKSQKRAFSAGRWYVVGGCTADDGDGDEGAEDATQGYRGITVPPRILLFFAHYFFAHDLVYV